MGGESGTHGRLHSLLKLVLSELKKVAEALQRHRFLVAPAVGAVSVIFLTGIPGVLKFSLQHLGPFGTVALVIFGVFYVVSPLLVAPKKIPQ